MPKKVAKKVTKASKSSMNPGKGYKRSVAQKKKPANKARPGRSPSDDY